MIGITQDELKSQINTELILTTAQLAQEINIFYTNNWLSPLLLIRSGVENQALGANEKASFLSAGIENIEDIVSLTLFFEVRPGVQVQAVQTYKESFKARLDTSSLQASQILDVSFEELADLKQRNKSLGEPAYVPELDAWLMTMTVPVHVAGAPSAILAARITLTSLRERVQNHPFNKNGRIFLIDVHGQEIFGADRRDLSSLKLVQDAMELLRTRSRAQGVTNYETPNGEKVLGSYAFPLNLEWVVLAETAEAKAYLAVTRMRRTLIFWMLIGLALAVAGVVPFSRQISRPILKISKAAEQISSGNFNVEVDYQAKDEIGRLGQTLVGMSRSLQESFAKIEKQNKELEEYSKTLEEKVGKRTHELKEKNLELESTLQQLQQTQKQLIVQEKLASLGALTAGIAHEIKNPLNFVNNFAALSVELADELQAEISQRQERFKEDDLENVTGVLQNLKMNAAKIAEHGKRADNIVRGMLQHSRGESGEMQMTDLNKLLEDDLSLAYQGMRAQDPTFNIKIEKQLDRNIGAVKLNPQAFNRVIINICNNGFYATREKKQKADNDYLPTLTFTTANRGDQVEIKIRDNGTGIPSHVVDKIFNPFFTTKPAGMGTGLGLSISNDIVAQMHKGELKVRTEPGSYTEFIILLPKQ